jgi:hypothetical protein
MLRFRVTCMTDGEPTALRFLFMLVKSGDIFELAIVVQFFVLACSVQPFVNL